MVLAAWPSCEMVAVVRTSDVRTLSPVEEEDCVELDKLYVYEEFDRMVEERLPDRRAAPLNVPLSADVSMFSVACQLLQCFGAALSYLQQ